MKAYLDLDIASKLGLEMIKALNAIPLNLNQNILTIGLGSQAQKTDILKNIFFAYEIEYVNLEQELFEKYLQKVQNAQKVNLLCEKVKQEISLNISSNEPSIIKLIDVILKECVSLNASDLHIEPTKDASILRARIDGMLTQIFTLDNQIFDALIARIKLLGGMDIADKQNPQDGRFSMTINEQECDFRISCLPLASKESMVIRILYKNHTALMLDSLGVSKNQLTALKRILNRPHGMLLVTGPTGCGKSTTLYAALNYLKDISKKIITIENPVEYKLDLIQQVRVSESLNFATALRAILRQDPDIIMLGEIRDPDTLATSIQAALSGHLVLSTLHTNDAISTITRMNDLGAAPYLIASSLSGILAQRLLRKLCSHCKVPQEQSKPDFLKNAKIYKAQGCQKCAYTGYMGRTIASEIVEIDENMASLIAKKASKEELKAQLGDGHISLFSSGVELVKQGLTSVDELFRTIGEQ